MIAFSVTGNELIHNSAARPDKLIFGLLAQSSELGQVYGLTRHLQQRIADGDFHRRGRAQPSALWEVAGNEQVGTGQPAFRRLEHFRNSDCIVAPLAHTGWWQVIQVELGTCRKILRLNDDFSVRAWSNRGPSVKPDRRWHDQPVVIIGMLANQIHSSGSLINPRGFPKHGSKFPCQHVSLLFGDWIRFTHARVQRVTSVSSHPKRTLKVLSLQRPSSSGGVPNLF